MGTSAACVPATAFNGAGESTEVTRDAAKLAFHNKRAEVWWRFREALDPDQEGGSAIALPADDELKADLASAQWELTARGIKLKPKDAIRERIGRSPGKGDAVVMAWAEGAQGRPAPAARQQAARNPRRRRLQPAHSEIRPLMSGITRTGLHPFARWERGSVQQASLNVTAVQAAAERHGIPAMYEQRE